MSFAAIALGSNLPGLAGSREANMNAAMLALGEFGQVVAHSTWIETEPEGYVGQPPFLNGAVVLQTDLPPLSLLAALLRIELAFGRDRSHGIAKGPRTLDLDLLLYDDLVLQTATLTLPHPSMHLRRFVLQPLAQIAPQWRHPVLEKTVAELLQSVS